MAEFTIAFDNNYQEVSIDDAQKGQEYICENCNHPMIPVRGEEREWHFRHKEVSPGCNHDEWLHNRLVQLLYERLCSEEQFKIKCPDYEIYSRNVAVEKERMYRSFRPDILIQESNDEVYFLEICVTHPCTEEKRKSGIKIIEIETSDTRVINELKSGDISGAGQFYRVNYHNFPVPENEKETINDVIDVKTVYAPNSYQRNCYFVLHRDKTYDVYNHLTVGRDDLMVLGVNVTTDFAMNIGKAYAYRKGLLSRDKLSEYETHVDIPAIIEYFNLVEYNIAEIYAHYNNFNRL